MLATRLAQIALTAGNVVLKIGFNAKTQGRKGEDSQRIAFHRSKVPVRHGA